MSGRSGLSRGATGTRGWRGFGSCCPFDHAIVGIDLADPGGAECHVPPQRRGSSGSSVPGNGEPDMALSATPGRSPPRVQFPVIRCLDLAPRVIGGPQANL